MTVTQVERHTEDEVREYYLQMKAKYIDQWDTESLFTAVAIQINYCCLAVTVK